MSKPILLGLGLMLLSNLALAETTATRLFAIEFSTGPTWDAAKPPHEQAHFAEHSANLQRLRKAEALRIGARLGERGLIVIAAADEAAAKAEIEQDPSVKAGVFVYQLNEFRVFYGGSVEAPARKKP